MISCNQIIQCALSTHVLIYSQSLKLSKGLYTVFIKDMVFLFYCSFIGPDIKMITQ